MERERKKRKKFDTDGGEEEPPLPELLPPAALTVTSNTMENINVFKVNHSVILTLGCLQDTELGLILVICAATFPLNYSLYEKLSG